METIDVRPIFFGVEVVLPEKERVSKPEGLRPGWNSWRGAVSSLSTSCGVWGNAESGAPAEIKFGTFYMKKLASDGDYK